MESLTLSTSSEVEAKTLSTVGGTQGVMALSTREMLQEPQVITLLPEMFSFGVITNMMRKTLMRTSGEKPMSSMNHSNL